MKKDFFWVLILLFLVTVVIIPVYENQNEPLPATSSGVSLKGQVLSIVHPAKAGIAAQNKNQTSNPPTASVAEKNITGQSDTINCDPPKAQAATDELSSLLANQTQNSEVNNCLFLGCNGFF